MRIEVIGPLRVLGDNGRNIAIPPQEARLLRVLCLLDGSQASIDTLVEVLGANRPVKRETVISYRSTLVKRLGTSIIRTSASGGESTYQLLLQAKDSLDLRDFRNSIAEAELRLQEGDPEGALESAKRALDLWRGDPTQGIEVGLVTGLVGSPREYALLHADCERAYHAAVVQLGVEAELRATVRELSSLVATDDHQYDERFHHLLAQAHVALGERAAAVEAWDRATGTLGLPASDSFRDLITPLLARGRETIGQLPTVGETGANADNKSSRLPWLGDYRRWLSTEVRLVDLRPFGFASVTDYPLAQVFVPLFVRMSPGHAAVDVERPTLDEAARASPRLLIVGESGSGKTTFLNHLCLESLGSNSTVPVMLDLSVAAERYTRSGEDRLRLDTLFRAFTGRLAEESVHVEVDDLTQLAEEGQLLFLLDSLNEIPEPATREAITNLIERCASRWHTCRFVVTATPTSVKRRAQPLGFQRVDVDEFRPGDVREFMRRAAGALTNHEPPITPSDAERLANMILHDADLRSLARRPLQLTAMLLVYFEGGRHALPETLTDLLEATTSWVISKRSSILSKITGSKKAVEEAFTEIAYQMVTKETRPQNRVGKRWVAEAIMPALGDSFERAEAFVRASLEAGGLIYPRGAGDVGMLDLFRDYLAAARIAGFTDEEGGGWWIELRDHLDDPDWQRVVRLVPACLNTLGSDRVSLFLHRLGISCAGLDLAGRARRVALGGAVMRELRMAELAPAEARGWSDAVSDITPIFERATHLEVDLETRFEAATAFGLLGDPRLHDEGELWAEIETGSFLMGSQANDIDESGYDPDAAPWEAPVTPCEVPEFEIRRYPIVVAEYEAFVTAGGYTPSGRQYWDSIGWDWMVKESIATPAQWDDQIETPNAPVAGVSWFEARAFCRWMTSRQRTPGRTIRLPSESEWEYAARRDVTPGRRFSWGNRMEFGETSEANWAGSYLRRKSPVGMFPMSTTSDGIADLFGNVEEWCEDEWRAPDPWGDTTEASLDTTRAVRGGSCIRFARLCRPTYRSRVRQTARYLTVGFRPVRTARR